MVTEAASQSSAATGFAFCWPATLVQKDGAAARGNGASVEPLLWELWRPSSLPGSSLRTRVGAKPVGACFSGAAFLAAGPGGAAVIGTGLEEAPLLSNGFHSGRRSSASSRAVSLAVARTEVMMSPAAAPLRDSWYPRL